MPTIYFDESSRGYHGNPGRTPYVRGRWVGERTENGKRIRMRSTDYDKVLAWVQGTPKEEHKGIPLRGLPQYSVSIINREVYNSKTHRWLKGSLECGRRIFHLVHNGVNHSLSWERIAYAALHDIEVLKIPSDLVVVESEGEYLLQHAGDFQVIQNRRMRDRKLTEIYHILKRRIREAEMLQRYYKSHNPQEIVTYATKDIFDHMVRHIMQRHRCTMQRATDVVTEATEQFLERITTGTLPAVTISCTIRGMCQKAIAKGTKKREYFE